MKIEIEIPDWVDNEKRGLHIFAGIERVAYKMPWQENWYIKTQRCSMCGRCCMRINCPELEKEPGRDDKRRCGVALAMPYTCLVSKPRNIKECTIRFEEVR